ncbi:unnamed protein product [Gadus morhua 'NCC']
MVVQEGGPEFGLQVSQCRGVWSRFGPTKGLWSQSPLQGGVVSGCPPKGVCGLRGGCVLSLAHPQGGVVSFSRG